MATSLTTVSHSDNAPPQPPESLALDIFNATREMHIIANKLIISRVEMVLASDACQYISGMLYFLPVYMTFEKLWQNVILDTPPEETASEDGRPKVSEHVHTILKLLRNSKFSRSDPLRADIKSIIGWSDDVLDRQIHDITQTGELSDFISHIEKTIRAKPHTLIAYSYNLYLALFKGGFIIRKYLEEADDKFWENVPTLTRRTNQTYEATSDEAATSPPEPKDNLAEASLQTKVSRSTMLQFWRFDTEEHGEDLRREYKETLLSWEGELSSDERDDIIKESVIILENLISIVNQLDKIHSTEQKISSVHEPDNTYSNKQKDSTVDQPENTSSDEQEENVSIQTPKRLSLASLFGQVQLITRWRDSIMITRERWGYNISRSQSVITTTSEEGEWDSENQDANHEDVATDVKLSPGTHKSMRFAESLAVPSRRRVRVAAAKNGGLNSMPKQAADATMPRPVLVGIVGLLLLYIFFRVRGIMGWENTAMVQ